MKVLKEKVGGEVEVEDSKLKEDLDNFKVFLSI